MILKNNNKIIAIINATKKLIKINKEFKNINKLISFCYVNDIQINNNNNIVELKRVDILQNYIKAYKIEFIDFKGVK